MFFQFLPCCTSRWDVVMPLVQNFQIRTTNRCWEKKNKIIKGNTVQYKKQILQSGCLSDLMCCIQTLLTISNTVFISTHSCSYHPSLYSILWEHSHKNFHCMLYSIYVTNKIEIWFQFGSMGLNPTWYKYKTNDSTTVSHLSAKMVDRFT